MGKDTGGGGRKIGRGREVPVDIRTTRGGRDVGRMLARAAARLKVGGGRAMDTTGGGRRTTGCISGGAEVGGGGAEETGGFGDALGGGGGAGEGVDEEATAEGVALLRVEAVLVLVVEAIAGAVVGGTLVVVEPEDAGVISFF